MAQYQYRLTPLLCFIRRLCGWRVSLDGDACASLRRLWPLARKAECG
jgi:hypothetical protein